MIIEGIDAYLRRREQQERVASLKAKCPDARAAHLHMAESYREQLRARRIARLRMVLIDLPAQGAPGVGYVVPRTMRALA